VKPEKIKNIIDGQPCFVIGGGPSAVNVPHDNVIVPNLGFRLNPDPLAFYFADGEFYQKYEKEIEQVNAKYWITTNQLMMLEPKWVMFHRNATMLGEFNRVMGTNSGLHCAHIALKMGADPVVLVGFDMKDRTHFHGEYLMGENSVVKYTREFEVLQGQNVYLTTEDSGLRHIFPYKPLKDFL
jgi:hypothetical protein